MITPESTIAHYRVDTLIGAGAMGEVYRATDARLGRAVALKVLSPDLSHSADRIRRFLQEAKAASSLNHPNIITVYDAGDEQPGDGGPRVYFIATELVEGRTLRSVIHQEKTPLKRVVGYLAQAADGIAKAHAAGIVHRDLKPDNIMVTADGFAKVLDFGLAKLTETSAGQSTLPDATREGVIMGTVSYMSPEQAQGLTVDHRSDIFAFGAILYEAAAGRAPFRGRSDPEILHAIIHEEPLPLAQVPGELDRLVVRAMAKDPDERIQSMKDLALELRDISRTFESLRLTSPRRVRRRLQATWPWVAFAAAALLAGAVAGYMVKREPARPEPIRFAIAAPEGTSFAAQPNSASALQFALSADGRKLAAVAAPQGGKPQIWLRELDSVEARPIAGTEGAWYPFWSPRGDAIAFFADGKLKRISIHGGSPVVLTDADDPRGGSWSKDDVILFAGRGGRAPLYRVPAAGGEATLATALVPARGDLAHRWPHFLPDGERFVFLAVTARSQPSVYVSRLGSNEAQRVLTADSNAQYAASAQSLLYISKGNLLSQRVDPQSMRAVGDVVLVRREVGFAPVVRYGSFSVSETNVLGYAPWVNPNRRLSWLDRQGRVLAAASEPADWGTTALSLHGDRAAVPRVDPETGNFDIWTVDVTRGVASRLTTAESDEHHPLWSPDGSAIMFNTSYGSGSTLTMRMLGSSADRPVVTPNDPFRASDWAPDRQHVVYDVRVPNQGVDIWLLPVRGGMPARPFVATPFYEWDGRISPDGRWIAYVSNDSGREEVYVQPFPSGGDRYRVSTAGGMTPVWSPTGEELFFATLRGEIAAAPVLGRGERFAAGPPETLFRLPGVVAPQPAFRTAYAATADGRFLVTVTPADQARQSIHIAVNWQ